jgi:hypothetical protein
MPGGKGQIRPEDGKQFSSEYQPEEKWTEKKALELGRDLIEWLKEGGKKNIYFEEYIVIERDFYPSLTAYLCKKYSSFSKLINKAKKIQELKLVKYGVDDKLNATMTKFVLTNHHNYTDKVVKETTEKKIQILDNNPLDDISSNNSTTKD